jgi:replicative DNA helicase
MNSQSNVKPISWAEYQGEDRVISSAEMQAKFANEPPCLFELSSGIPTLDSLVEKFRDGELITISGYTKQGKTLLAQTLTKRFADEHHFSLWFTYEVPVKQFLHQFPSCPLIYMPSMLKAHDMNWVENRIAEAEAKFGTRIIFIDHLHFLFDMARAKNTSLEIGTVVRRLKQIANSGFLIFLLCHTSKGKSEDGPTYESIRDSSLIAQESDSVFMVQRTPDVSDTAAKMRVEFHRRTGVMEKVVQLQKTNGYLVERTDQEKTKSFYDYDK